MVEDSDDARWRIFEDLRRHAAAGDGSISRDHLLEYSVGGTRLPLIDRSRGIRNPEPWNETLSILTSERGPYRDREVSPGVWRYPYEVTSRGETGSSNAKLRAALAKQRPILYFYSPAPNTYLLVGLVEVIDDDPRAREFTIALADLGVSPTAIDAADTRAWIRREVDQRLHQPRFRQIVLPAYDDKCAVCALPVRNLLEAAHIRPDKDPELGQPIVQNGLSLCRTHHRAYDKRYLGIDENHTVHISKRVTMYEPSEAIDWYFTSRDTLTLQVIPPASKRPDPVRLRATFNEFLAATTA